MTLLQRLCYFGFGDAGPRGRLGACGKSHSPLPVSADDVLW